MPERPERLEMTRERARSERRDLDTLEHRALRCELGASACEERDCAMRILVGEMMHPHGNLNQPLDERTLGVLEPPPGGLEHPHP